MVDVTNFRGLLEGMSEDEIQEMLDKGEWGGPGDTRNREARLALRERGQGPSEKADRRQQKAEVRWKNNRMILLGVIAIVAIVAGFVVFS